MARSLVPVLAAALAALTLILIAASLTMQHVEAAASLLFLILAAASTGLVFLVAQRGRPSKHIPSIVTVISCMGCDYREEREFKVGDFVFKRLDSCARCGKELFISAIYSVTKAKES